MPIARTRVPRTQAPSVPQSRCECGGGGEEPYLGGSLEAGRARRVRNRWRSKQGVVGRRSGGGGNVGEEGSGEGVALGVGSQGVTLAFPSPLLG